jgi:hypothetical protein
MDVNYFIYFKFLFLTKYQYIYLKYYLFIV